MGPSAFIVLTSAVPPGVSVMRSRITSSTTSSASPASSATRSRNAGSNAISPRIARSVMAATCALRSDEIGQFVDAFLPDHGGIHVGEKKLLAPARALLHDDVEAKAFERCAQPCLDDRGLGVQLEGNIDGDAGGELDRRLRPVQRLGGARQRHGAESGLVGIGDQRGDMRHRAGHDDIEAVLLAGPTASGKSALALELAECTVAAPSSTPIRCRSTATSLSSPPGQARRTSHAAPHRLYGHVDGASNHSAGLWRDDAAALLPSRRAAASLPIFTGGTGPLFQGPGERSCGDASGPAGGP